MHAQTLTSINPYVLSTFLCISLSPKNAFPHTPTTTERLHSLERTIAQVIQRSKVCYSSERASWATSNKTDATGLCMCASLLTWAKPVQHNVYLCTLASAHYPIFARQWQYLYPKPPLPVTQSTVYNAGISISIHTRPRGHSESMKTTLSHADHLSTPSWLSWAVPQGLGAPQHRNPITMLLFWGQWLLVKYGAKGVRYLAYLPHGACSTAERHVRRMAWKM